MGLIGDFSKMPLASGTSTTVSNEVSRRQSGRWAAQDQLAPYRPYRPPLRGRWLWPMFQEPAQRHAQQVYAQQLQAGAPPASSHAAAASRPAPVNDMSTKLAQLEQLGALKTRGILNDAEFDEQKRKILGS